MRSDLEASEFESMDALTREVRRLPWSESWALLAIAALLSSDLLADERVGRSRTHFVLELCAAFVALAAVAWVWVRSVRARRRLARRLQELERAGDDAPARRVA